MDSFVVYYTHSVTVRDFKMDSQDFSTQVEGQMLFSEIKAKQRAERGDNACLFVRDGEIICKNGDTELLQELIKGMKSDYKRKKQSQEEEEQKAKADSEADTPNGPA